MMMKPKKKTGFKYSPPDILVYHPAFLLDSVRFITFSY